ncbi:MULTISPECIES: helix-turn-helix domain-containing protein [Ensifer]|uniref:Transcriptional regulator n=1 Tax=Ensifer canadensis TaxID=555315 RepID=A0AAW4FJ42_9HYPH|nr:MULTISPECIES: helix-turn-helix domain-containing protein [Ensifer]AHK44762.1 putative transcriptional regulator protein [Ensifer adhaerens OV14]MBD9488528.1 helix-turn-helix transcriptional regulator [Ensifer sp. ENS11]MBM3092115.1 transcriptional regulator [Ensifer canadensis]UBI77371.1 helix-turn-helix transcriptional regulator [Ensifer canadensis]
MNPTMENCGFATALKAIEGKWKVDILCELGKAARRFGRLRQSIPAISEKMLAQQLRELEADGLVDRTVYSSLPAKVVYSLTERGAALNVAAAALCRWGEEGGRHGKGSVAVVDDAVVA